jgi:hypothetical protein
VKEDEARYNAQAEAQKPRSKNFGKSLPRLKKTMQLQRPAKKLVNGCKLG